jgi:hypothetical protein
VRILVETIHLGIDILLRGGFYGVGMFILLAPIGCIIVHPEILAHGPSHGNTRDK